MRLVYTEKFMQKYELATVSIQRAMDKQAVLLRNNICRDTYNLHDIKLHPK